MRKIIDEFSVGKYKVLVLNDDPPKKLYNEYLIDGKCFKIVPVYDVKKWIVIESKESFVGKDVVFR